MKDKKITGYLPGLLLTLILALAASHLSSSLAKQLISPGVFALLLGMALNPFLKGKHYLDQGLSLVAKKVLKLAIVLMGASLTFYQVMEVGKYSLIVMTFTLFTAFFFGYYLGKVFKMNWKLSSLISAGTGICGGSAIAALAPTIDADSTDIAYSISATFLFDIVMVVLFPLAGRYFNMTDLGFGLWTGTAVNDTSSVLAAGYAFSDAAGNFSLIVKLTRTLSIIPVVLIFSYINSKIKADSLNRGKRSQVKIRDIFPWFILLFLAMVTIKSLGLISDGLSYSIAEISKFFMLMSLASIGLNTNFKELSKSGILPMVHGFIISLLVVVVSFSVQYLLGQI